MVLSARSSSGSRPGAGPGGEFMLVCRARERVCALDLASVAETLRPLPIEPLAGVPEFVLGVALIRGEPTPVVDAGALLGLSSPPSFTRFVTLRVGDRRVALAVEEVIGARALAGLSLTEVPPLLRHSNPQVIAALGAMDARLLTVLDTGRLVPEATWSALVRQEGNAGDVGS